MNNKYSACKVHWHSDRKCVLSSLDLERVKDPKTSKLPKNIITFDSRHEFRVWLELCKIYGEHRVLLQTPIEIIPPGSCYPRGKKWKADFAIIDDDNRHTISHLVEAKGYVTMEFTFILSLIELHKPFLFERLMIVFPKAIPTDKKIIKNLNQSDFADNLLTFKQLQSQDFKL